VHPNFLSYLPLLLFVSVVLGFYTIPKIVYARPIL